MVLESEGHTVLEAAHGEAALKTIRQILLPDVVTTDLTQAEVKGEELIRELRSDPATARIPIVVISGDLDAARALQAAGLVEAVLVKPFEPAHLARCIKDVT